MNFRQIIAIEKANKERWLKVNPAISEESGIYILTREEDGIKYAYIGQAKHILTRLAEHLSGYNQHIDLSLKKHKLYSEKNTNGWKVDLVYCAENELNDKEQEYIRIYSNGYQLRNKTIGSQSKGKNGLDVEKQPKGYYDGKKQGKRETIKEIAHLFDKYLEVAYKGEKTKLKERAMAKFKEILRND